MSRACFKPVKTFGLFSNIFLQGYTQEKVKLLLQRAFLPKLEGLTTFTVNPETMQDMVVIQGGVLNAITREEFVGPCYIPKTVHKVQLQVS